MDISTDYIAGVLDMRGWVGFDLTIPEAPNRSPMVDAYVQFSVGEDEFLAGLIDEYLVSLDINAPFSNDSSIRITIRNKEDVAALNDALSDHSIELRKGLQFITDHEFTKEDLVKNPVSTVRFVKTVQKIHPNRRSADHNIYSPSAVARQLGVSGSDVSPFELADVSVDEYLSREYMGGVFDAIGRYSLRISRNATYNLGYSIQPVIQLNKTSLHPVTVSLITETLDGYDVPINLSTQSDIFSINAILHGPERIRAFHDAFGEAVHTSLPTMEAFVRDILPRFEQGLHHTKQGFFDILYLAERKLELFEQEPKYNLEYFAERWSGDIDTYDVESAPSS